MLVILVPNFCFITTLFLVIFQNKFLVYHFHSLMLKFMYNGTLLQICDTIHEYCLVSEFLYFFTFCQTWSKCCDPYFPQIGLCFWNTSVAEWVNVDILSLLRQLTMICTCQLMIIYP